MCISNGALRRLTTALAAAGCVALAACTPTVEAPQRLGDPELTGGEGVCGLLVTEELELVLNTALDDASQEAAGAAAPGFASRPIVAGMDMCARSPRDGDASVAWGVLTDPPPAPDGAERDTDRSVADVFDDYAEWHRRYLDDADVAGHDAVWDQRLGILLVRGDGRLVAVSLAVPDPRQTTTTPTVRHRARDLAARILERV